MAAAAATGAAKRADFEDCLGGRASREEEKCATHSPTINWQPTSVTKLTCTTCSQCVNHTQEFLRRRRGERRRHEAAEDDADDGALARCDPHAGINERETLAKGRTSWNESITHSIILY